ncbi:MAG: hypothetical protein GF388_07325 [Candidatus Aegiribacteria sp.]|nr:hypothetical protein [Candidatus Aegiribacteria sp.]MBD3294943.1 hypothetical protein [Candidatus Fermentibacteria bacterium]
MANGEDENGGNVLEEAKLAALRRGKVVEYSPDTLRERSHGLEELSRVDGMNGEIVLLKLGSEWLVREPSPRDSHLLRLFRSREDAQSFIDGRMAQFERMWDGCGCRIDYDSHEAE